MAQPRRACTHRLRAPLGHACLLKGGTIFTSPAGRSSTAFDFNVSISDHERQRRREAEMQQISSATDPLAAAANLLPEAASLYRSTGDLSLKEGETIK